jgi:hypothetical protein
MPSVIKVEVKWQKEVFKDVEVDLEQPASEFKVQLYSLTGVPPERQKVMGVKGGLLKDDADWTILGLKPGQKLTMMGSAEAVPEAPKEQPTFMEDLPEGEQDSTGYSKYGAGLENLGNTCYMNSTMQCLYAVPELRDRCAACRVRQELSGLPAHSLPIGSLKPLDLLHRFCTNSPSFPPHTPLPWFLSNAASPPTARLPPALTPRPTRWRWPPAISLPTSRAPRRQWAPWSSS